MSESTTEKLKRAKIGVDATPASPAATRSTTAADIKPEQAKGATDNNDANKERFEKILSKLEALTDGVNVIQMDVGNLKCDMVEVKDSIQGVQTATTNMEARLEKELAEMSGVLVKTKEELVHNRVKLAITEQKLAASNNALKSISVRMTQLENRGRQCNIIVDGLPETADEDIRQKIMDIAERICPGKVSRESFQAIYRMGKIPNGGNRNSKRVRATMVIFKDVRTRNCFYFSRTQLKTIELLKGIYLSDDVTIETRRARDEYRSVANIARNAGVNVRVHDDGLVLNGTKYKLFEAESLPTEYSLAKAKTLETTQGIFFHSENSFLSNFYASPIWADGCAFPTAEHRYQSQKCKMAGDMIAMKRVLTAPTPLEAKKIAELVPENAEWRSKKEAVMQNTIDEKFMQNEELAKMLIGTGNAKLHEATMNTYFGIGATLHSREVRDSSFKGLNKLGDILQKKRAELATVADGN